MLSHISSKLASFKIRLQNSTNSQTHNIKHFNWDYLDWSMAAFAILSTILILMGVLGDSQIYVIGILCCYLIYILIFKFGSFGSGKNNTNKKPIKRISEDNISQQRKLSQQNLQNYILNDKKLMHKKQASILSNQSQFIKDYHSLNYSKSIQNKHQGKSKNQKSIIDSLKRSKTPQKTHQQNNRLSSGSSLGLIFQHSKNSASGSQTSNYVQVIQQSLKFKESMQQQIQKFSNTRKIEYLQTLKNLKIEDNDIEPLISNIKQICVKMARQLYEKSTDNIIKIVENVEKNYKVQINWEGHLSLKQKYLKNNQYHKTQKKKRIKLNQLFTQLLTHKPQNIPLPLKELPKNKDSTSANYEQEQERKKLQKLLFVRKQINQSLYIPNKSSISATELFNRLQALKQYINYNDNSSAYFQQNYIQRSDESQLRDEVGFNVVRTKINQLVPKDYLKLSFERQYLYGFLKLSQSKFRIKKKPASIQTFQHYNLYDKQKKQTYNCKFGHKNTFCLLYFYFLALLNNHSKQIRLNNQICYLIYDATRVKIV